MGLFTRVKTSPGEARRHKILVFAGLLLVAMILRSPLTAIAPIVGELRRDLHIDSATIGLLTGIPVLCFGLLTPFASYLIAKLSIERAIFAMLGGTFLGIVLRSLDGAGAALAGTFVLGTSLTVGNIVSLMVIARDFPRASRIVTGTYASFINVGTMASMAVTAPLASLIGWRLALGATALLVVPALLVWSLAAKHAPAEAPAQKARQTHAPTQWKRPLVWLLTAVFATHQALYYCLTAWLPDYFIQDTGMSATKAGLIAAVFQILALLGSFGVPVVARHMSLSWVLVVVGACWTITPLGLLFAPQWWFLWMLFGGFAMGGGFTAVFALIMSRARDLSENRTIAAFVQGGGYTIAATTPILMGHLHQSLNSWSLAFILLAAAGVVMTLSGIGVTKAK
ncbi:MFS transporter [Rhizomicrobium palustre]